MQGISSQTKNRSRVGTTILPRNRRCLVTNIEHMNVCVHCATPMSGTLHGLGPANYRFEEEHGSVTFLP